MMSCSQTKDISMTKSDAAILTSTYWGSFTFGRFVSIFLATKLSPTTMMSFNFGGTLFACILLTVFHTSCIVESSVVTLGCILTLVRCACSGGTVVWLGTAWFLDELGLCLHIPAAPELH